MIHYTYVVGLRAEPLYATVAGPVKGEVEIIMDRICEAWYITPQDLKHKTKVAEIKFARWMLWRIMRNKGWSLSGIARMLGNNYNHTTVINALTKLPDDIEKMPHVKDAYKKIIDLDPNPLPCP